MVFHTLNKIQLIDLAKQYNIINKLRNGYSKFTKPELIAELKNHLKYNEQTQKFETLSNSITTRTAAAIQLAKDLKPVKPRVKKNAVAPAPAVVERKEPTPKTAEQIREENETLKKLQKVRADIKRNNEKRTVYLNI